MSQSSWSPEFEASLEKACLKIQTKVTVFVTSDERANSPQKARQAPEFQTLVLMQSVEEISKQSREYIVLRE